MTRVQATSACCWHGIRAKAVFENVWLHSSCLVLPHRSALAAHSEDCSTSDCWHSPGISMAQCSRCSREFGWLRCHLGHSLASCMGRIFRSTLSLSVISVAECIHQFTRIPISPRWGLIKLLSMLLLHPQCSAITLYTFCSLMISYSQERASQCWIGISIIAMKVIWTESFSHGCKYEIIYSTEESNIYYYLQPIVIYILFVKWINPIVN